MDVIAVKTRMIERVIPAHSTDPANPTSFERVMEAGQVWYPNSAHKTAQAIFDFNHKGLPLIIFVNWHGVSGGQQDMYDEVLKQGSKIINGSGPSTSLTLATIAYTTSSSSGDYPSFVPLCNTSVSAAVSFGFLPSTVP